MSGFVAGSMNPKYERARRFLRDVVLFTVGCLLLAIGAPRLCVAREEPTQKDVTEAPVTIVAFVDLACSYSAKTAPTLERLQREYGSKLRLVIKHDPLPEHPNAFLAHEALLAAGEQGKFWPMYRLLFTHQSELSYSDLLAYAKQLDLSISAFQRALDSHQFKPRIERDLLEADGFGVMATPTFFVNGTKHVGARSWSQFRAIIDFELKSAESYATPDAKQRPVASEIISPDSAPAPVLKTDGAPARGAASASIEIVEFSDLQCPYCAREVPVLKNLLASYPNQVRWVFKHYPLSFHADSPLAHQALEAAGEQGRFWEMHDLIFQNQRSMKRDDLMKFAAELNLNLVRFDHDLKREDIAQRVQRDKQEGDDLGVDGTPSFFVNGKALSGAISYDALSDLLTSHFGARREGVDAIADTSKRASKEHVLLWFADYESPLTPKAAEMVRRVKDTFGDRLKVVVKHSPLIFHGKALPVHEAVIAAGLQGKFWEMQDLVLSHAGAASRGELIAYAESIHLDIGKFEKEMDSRESKEAVLSDLEEARLRNVTGTPTFFLDGKRMDGLQLPDRFVQEIAAQLNGQIASAAGQQGSHAR